MASATTEIMPDSINERKYHDTTSAYVLPNDKIEQERLDAQAAAIVEMIGGTTFLTPTESLATAEKAVDVGCGTGVATLQIASTLPSTKVYGLDISTVPEASKAMAPSNVAWVTGNVLDVDYNQPATDQMTKEVFTPKALDFIFGRMLFLGINNWSRYFSTAYEALKPGGIIEHQDLDWKFYRVGTNDCLSDDWEWHKRIVRGAESTGLSTHAGSEAAHFMKTAGFEVLSVQTFEFSFVPSSKTPNSQAMGRYVQAKLIPQYPELLRKMLASQGIVGNDLETLTQECLHNITREEGVHQKYTVTIARNI